MGKLWPLTLTLFQLLVLWHCEHCPDQWLEGGLWQDWQLVWPEWSKLALLQELVLWQFEHCPL